jgi:hypothetical protein
MFASSPSHENSPQQQPTEPKPAESRQDNTQQSQITSSPLGELKTPPNPPQDSKTVHAESQGKKPDVEFAISTFTPNNPPDLETAQAVKDLFIRVYGDTHNRPFLQSPQNFVDEVATGGFISFVARDSGGKVVAHTAVVNLGEKVVEIDLQLADPAVRGNRVGSVLKDLALQKIMDLHAEGQVDVIRADCVTSHPITQKYAERIELKTVGLFDRKYYDFFGKGNLESVVQLERLLNQDIKQQRDVYLPPTMTVMADNIYRQHGCKREISHAYDYAGALEIPAAKLTCDKHEIQAFNALTITANPGVSPFELSQAVNNAFKDGIQHVSVRLDIGHPAALDQINALRANGFYYASLHMRQNGDFLVLQKPSFSQGEWACPGDLRLHHEDTRLLVNLIRASQAWMK